MIPVRVFREDLQCHRTIIQRSSVSHPRCDLRHCSHHSIGCLRIHSGSRDIKVKVRRFGQHCRLISGPIPQTQILDPENLPSPDPAPALARSAISLCVRRRVIPLARCGHKAAGYTHRREIRRAVHGDSIFFFSVRPETAAVQIPASFSSGHQAVSPAGLITYANFSHGCFSVDNNSSCHISAFFRICADQSRKHVSRLCLYERMPRLIASGDSKQIHTVRCIGVPGEALQFQQNLTVPVFRDFHPALLPDGVLPGRPHLLAALPLVNRRISAAHFQSGRIDVLISNTQ